MYVWIASLLFIAVCAWWRPVAGVAWQARPPGAVGAWAVQAAGIWLTLRSAVVLDFRELAGLRRNSSSRTRPSGSGRIGVQDRRPVRLGAPPNLLRVVSFRLGSIADDDDTADVSLSSVACTC